MEEISDRRSHRAKRRPVNPGFGLRGGADLLGGAEVARVCKAPMGSRKTGARQASFRVAPPPSGLPAGARRDPICLT
ncbi:MAG: hypothetical protein CMI50_14285 [Paracoccus sp.]|nr:hypothetical protein [Paracoccus sp. (in: a-proteobacteria)]